VYYPNAFIHVNRGFAVDVKSLKQSIRERIWALLEERGVAAFPRPIRGRIPNFQGSNEACGSLTTLPEFNESHVVKVNPDAPQRRCRELVLSHGKLLIMPTPRIREGFLLLDPGRIPVNHYREASTIGGAFRWSSPVDPHELPKIDLVITGSVAVNSRGRRIGKSHGYAEIEWGVLSTLNKVDENTPVVTTVHDLQFLSDEIPREPFDLPVDIVVTPSRVIRINRIDPKPSGIYWEYVTTDMIREIPLLREMLRKGET
jgi:5-formyltetrahydrofolate cyclo-ligase